MGAVVFQPFDKGEVMYNFRDLALMKPGLPSGHLGCEVVGALSYLQYLHDVEEL